MSGNPEGGTVKCEVLDDGAIWHVVLATPKENIVDMDKAEQIASIFSRAKEDKGLPRKNAWFTVKRQAMTADAADPVGLYFGTTSGEIWMSASEGKSWYPIAVHLPHIYSVEVATR